jgi:hypothetical protein
LVIYPVSAQSGGQFCIQSFEDRNGNGVHDGGEPLIVRGVTASLQDVNGIIIATASLEDSPTAAQGFVCFQQLAGGQYTVTVASSVYNPTTADSFTSVISETGVPTVFEFGGQAIVSENIGTTTVGATLSSRAQVEGLVFGFIGAAVVVAVMIVLGVIVGYFVFRRRLSEARYIPVPGTGPMQAVRDTDSFPVAPYSDEDTGQHRPV